MQHHDDAGKIMLPGLDFDLKSQELHRTDGARVALRPQTRAVLNCLARAAGSVVSKDELMQTVWPDTVVTDDSLVQCIKELRRAVGDIEHRIVQTEPKRGYRLATTRTGDFEPAPASARRNFEQQIRFATGAGGTRIAYAVSGDGPPLVRTAQWMTHLEWDWQSPIFGEFIQRLSQQNRLVRYDGRGCGLSDRGVPVASDLDDEVRDLEAVVDAAGLERFALLGRSQGGAVAIRYAARHPERVTRLVTIGGYARGPLRRGRDSRSLENIQAFCKLLEDGWGNVNSAFRQMWTSHAFPGATTEQQDSYNQMQRVACSPEDAAIIFRINAEYDASTDLEQVRCPTLVLHNPDDALVSFEEGRLIASKIDGARLEPFTGRNHQPMAGEPAFEHVMAQIASFLREPDRSEAVIEGKRGSHTNLHVVRSLGSTP